jgi:hypothetical protein
MKYWVLLFSLFAFQARSDPPPGANPAFHAWFEKQYSINGRWCCNEADGHILDDSDWRTNGSGYEVRINGNWKLIPPPAMRNTETGGPNPTGHAVVWYIIGGTGDIYIYCFAQGFEG